MSVDFTTQKTCILEIRSTVPSRVAGLVQQAIWMSAALRVSTIDRVQSSHFTLAKDYRPNEDEVACYIVSIETADLSEKDESCWLPLFANSVIADGFPILERRNNEKGLELPLEMMAALGGARHLTDYDGGLVLKGHSALFYPVSCDGDSVQWHFVRNEDEQYLPYKEVKTRCPDRASLASVNFESLKNKRSFLGWCTLAETHLGTADADYSSIDWSSAGEVRRAAKISGAEIGFQTMITGKVGFMMGPKDGRLHFARTGPFEKIIRCAEESSVVLHDLEDHRAWLVPALDVILHIIKTRHYLSFYNVEGSDVQIVPADHTVTDGSAARKAAIENQWLQLYEGYHFQDAFLDIWSQMERLQEKEDSIEASQGLALHGTMREKLRGWEYMSLVHEKNYRQKETTVAKSSGGWADLVADVDTLVLFATGLREIIKPVWGTSKLCRRWRSLPTGKDYLAAGVPMLEVLYSEAGSKVSRKHLSTSHLQWHRGETLFEECTEATPDHCGCDRTQQIYHDSLFKTFGRVNPPGPLEKHGCVIFGRMKHAFKPTKTMPVKKNHIYNMSNLPLHSLKARSPSPEVVREMSPVSCDKSTNKDCLELDGHEVVSLKRPHLPECPRKDIPCPGGVLSPGASSLDFGNPLKREPAPPGHGILPSYCTVPKRRRKISSPTDCSGNCSKAENGNDPVSSDDSGEDIAVEIRPVDIRRKPFDEVDEGKDKDTNYAESDSKKEQTSEHILKSVRRMPRFDQTQHYYDCSCTHCRMVGPKPLNAMTIATLSSHPHRSQARAT